MTRPILQALAAGCIGMGLAACSPAPEEAASPTLLGHTAPTPSTVQRVRIDARLREAWHVDSAAARDPGALVSVRLSNVRRNARLLRAPARLVARLPQGTRQVRFWATPPLAEDPGRACSVELRASWGSNGPRHAASLASAEGGPDRWLALEVPAPETAVRPELWIDLEPGPGCGEHNVVAVSELVSMGVGDPPPRPNLLLVVIDTLRLDHLDCSDETAALAPHLTDRWCGRGIFFSDAHTTAPWTHPALASMLTGLPPRHHGATGGRDDPDMDPRVTTLAEVLRWQGYATGAVVSNWHATRGLWRGFDAFVELLPSSGPGLERRRAERVVNDAIAWLEMEATAPFFLWTLLIDLHEPVDATRRTGESPVECEGVSPVPFNWQELGTPDDPPTAHQERRMACRKALYRVALRYVDRQLLRLMTHLEQRGLDRNTWVVLVSDHGEEFWDHAAQQRRAGRTPRGIWGIGHGHTLYHELTRVPLLLVPPLGGGGDPRRSDVLASVEDVFATLLGLAGAPLPSSVEAQDLSLATRPGWRGAREMVGSAAIAYGAERRAVTTSRLRAIWTAPDEVLVFDRSADPGEAHPLPAGAPLATEGRRRLRAGFATPSAAALTPDDRDALDALGYLR